MPHFFQRRDIFGNTPALWVVCALLFLAPIAWNSLKQTRLENDIETWLAPEDPNLKVLNWAHQQFPVDERVFITWETSSLSDARIDALIAELEPVVDKQGIRRGGSAYVQSLAEPREILKLLQQNGVAPQEAVRRLQGVVLGGGPLRIRLTDAGRNSNVAFRPEEFARTAAAALGIPIRAVPVDEQLAAATVIPGYVSATGEEIPESPAAVLDVEGQVVDSHNVEHDLAFSWPAIATATPESLKVAEWLLSQKASGSQESLVESVFFVPGAPIAVAVALSEAGIAEKAQALDSIRAATEKVGIAPEELKLGGSAVASTELNHEVMNAVWNPSVPRHKFYLRSTILTSALAGALLAFLMLRSLRLAVIVLVGALYTTYLTLSLVPATGGTMNMVLVVMPTLLTVITLSGGIHVSNYWRHSAANDSTTAVVQSCRMAARPCLLSAVTTSIGLASLCTSSLSPVREFGLYSATGTLLSVLMVLFGIPSLFLLWPATPPHARDLDHAGWKWFGSRMTKHATLQMIASLLFAAIASYGLVYFRTETKVIRYFPETARIVHDYRFIEDHLAGIIPVETIVKFDQDAQAESNFLDRMEMVREIQEQMRRHPEITGCLSLADFQPVAELPDESSILSTSRYHRRANTAEERVRSGEINGVEAFYNVAEQAHDRDQSGDAKLNAAGDELWRITAQVNVMTDADYAETISHLNSIAQNTLRFQAGADHVVTGAVPLFLRTQQAVLDSLITSSFLAFGVILLIFIVQLKSIPAGIIAMIPNIVPITIVFGLISYFDVRIDIGTMITASIALGMAVDGTLHFLEWFKFQMAMGKTRDEAIVSAVTHSGPAIWHTSWMIGLSLLMLLPSELLLISRFGWLMSAMIGVALWGDLVLLPQILASPLGKLFEPRLRPPQVETPASHRTVSRGTSIPAAPHFDSNAAAATLTPPLSQ